jgi:hypothetical protein
VGVLKKIAISNLYLPIFNDLDFVRRTTEHFTSILHCRQFTDALYRHTSPAHFTGTAHSTSTIHYESEKVLEL